jgi:hypothetical protein
MCDFHERSRMNGFAAKAAPANKPYLGNSLRAKFPYLSVYKSDGFEPEIHFHKILFNK